MATLVGLNNNDRYILTIYQALWETKFIFSVIVTLKVFCFFGVAKLDIDTTIYKSELLYSDG